MSVNKKNLSYPTSFLIATTHASRQGQNGSIFRDFSHDKDTNKIIELIFIQGIYQHFSKKWHFLPLHEKYGIAAIFIYGILSFKKCHLSAKCFKVFISKENTV